MFTIMLRALGRNLDVDACLTWLPAARLDAVWRQADLRAGKPAETGGFNLLLGEADDKKEALMAAERQLSLLKEDVKKLVDAGNRASVDIGLYVFQNAPQSITLEADFLLCVTEAGASLVFSAYPCSDDDDDDDDE
jgi:hypothetical protein